MCVGVRVHVCVCLCVCLGISMPMRSKVKRLSASAGKNYETSFLGIFRWLNCFSYCVGVCGDPAGFATLWLFKMCNQLRSSSAALPYKITEFHLCLN